MTELITTQTEDFEIVMYGFDNQNDLDIFKQPIPSENILYKGMTKDLIQPAYILWLDKQNSKYRHFNKYEEVYTDGWYNYTEERAWVSPYQFDNPEASFVTALRKLNHPEYMLVVRKDENYE